MNTLKGYKSAYILETEVQSTNGKYPSALSVLPISAETPAQVKALELSRRRETIVSYI